MKKRILFSLLFLLCFKSVAEETLVAEEASSPKETVVDTVSAVSEGLPKLTYFISLPARVTCSEENFSITVVKGPEKVLNINFRYSNELTSFNMLVINNARYDSADKLMQYSDNDKTGLVAIKQMGSDDAANYINIGSINKEAARKSCLEKKQVELDNCAKYANEPDFHAVCVDEAHRYSKTGYQLELPVLLNSDVKPDFKRTYKCVNKWGFLDRARSREVVYEVNIKTNGVDNVYAPIRSSKPFGSIEDCESFQDGF